MDEEKLRRLALKAVEAERDMLPLEVRNCGRVIPKRDAAHGHLFCRLRAQHEGQCSWENTDPLPSWRTKANGDVTTDDAIPVCSPVNPAFANFIAAASPVNVLQLIDELERSRQALATREKTACQMCRSSEEEFGVLRKEIRKSQRLIQFADDAPYEGSDFSLVSAVRQIVGWATRTAKINRTRIPALENAIRLHLTKLKGIGYVSYLGAPDHAANHVRDATRTLAAMRATLEADDDIE